MYEVDEIHQVVESRRRHFNHINYLLSSHRQNAISPTSITGPKPSRTRLYRLRCGGRYAIALWPLFSLPLSHSSPTGRVVTNDPPRLRKSKSTPVLAAPTYDTSARRLAPEDVLFRRKNAPTRYEEHDIYWANERDLPVLPDSDLLKCVHSYTGLFYEGMAARKKGKRDGNRKENFMDERSMDETALLAFGVLLEEAGRKTLGKRGDLVFVEGEEREERDERKRIGVESETDGDPWKEDGDEEEELRREKGAKRRKLKQEI